MNEQTFFEEIRSRQRPVVVEFWAPWCAPCRIMAPALERAEQQFSGQVDLWKINADEEPELVRALGVLGIPTMIGFNNGQPVARQVGAQPVEAILTFFESVRKGEAPPRSLAPVERLLRLGSGLALAAVAIFSSSGWATGLLLVLGGLLMFSAVYDRCPVYRAIREWILGRGA